MKWYDQLFLILSRPVYSIRGVALDFLINEQLFGK